MMKKTMIGKIASILGKILLLLLILLCTFTIILTLSQKQNNGLANLFGYSPLSVQSDSMKGTGKTNFQAGDLIVVKSLSENKIHDLEVGDIITFQDIINGKREFNTHRIKEVINENGVLSFITQGDNNSLPDTNKRESQDVVAVYKGTKIAGGGKVLDFLNNRWGFFFCLVLPLALFFIWRIIKLIGAVRAFRKVQAEDDELPNVSATANWPQEGKNVSSTSAAANTLQQDMNVSSTSAAANPLQQDKNVPNTSAIANFLADANIDPEIIAAAMARANDKEKNSTGVSSGSGS